MSTVAATESWRNVTILGAAQALAASSRLVRDAGRRHHRPGARAVADVATLPIAAIVVGLACATVPTSMLIRRIGRRATLSLRRGELGGGAGGRPCHGDGHFSWFCAATFLMGAAAAIVAAVPVCRCRKRRRAACRPRGVPRARGGIIAGVLGPEIGRRGRRGSEEFSGAFVSSLSSRSWRSPFSTCGSLHRLLRVISGSRRRSRLLHAPVLSRRRGRRRKRFGGHELSHDGGADQHAPSRRALDQ